MDVLKSGGAKSSIVNASTKNLKKSIVKEIDNAGISKKAQIKEFSIKTLLDSLFKDLSTKIKSKDVVLQILKDKNIFLNTKDTVAELKSVIDSLKESKISTQTIKTLDKLLLSVDKLDAKSLQAQIKNSGIFLESKLANAGLPESLLPQSLKQTLQNLKSLPSDTGVKIDTSLIDKILSSKVANKGFIEDIKTLINSLKNSQNESLVQTTAKLEILLQKNQILESKVTNSIDVSSKDIGSVAKNIELVLSEIESNLPKIQETIGSLKTLLNMPQNLKIDISSVGDKLQQLVNLLKSELSVKLPNSQLHIEVSKMAFALKSDLNQAVNSREIMPNQILQTLQNPKDEIERDIKANLLHIKEELGKSGETAVKDMMPKIDRVLTSINYYQLLSYSMGSNVLYLPLLWDGLEEGQISIKKLKQNRFFCEINLKLKEFGKIDLLVMLFDDIHINISIFTQNSEFLSRIRENLQLLRQGISSLSLIPSNIYLYDSLKDERIKKDTKEYVQAQQVGTGISIYV